MPPSTVALLLPFAALLSVVSLGVSVWGATEACASPPAVYYHIYADPDNKVSSFADHYLQSNNEGRVGMFMSYLSKSYDVTDGLGDDQVLFDIVNFAPTSVLEATLKRETMSIQNQLNREDFINGQHISIETGGPEEVISTDPSSRYHVTAASGKYACVKAIDVKYENDKPGFARTVTFER